MARFFSCARSFLRSAATCLPNFLASRSFFLQGEMGVGVAGWEVSGNTTLQDCSWLNNLCFFDVEHKALQPPPPPPFTPPTPHRYQTTPATPTSAPPPRSAAAQTAAAP